MGEGLQQPWSTEQTEEWRRTARTTRERLVDEAAEAVGSGRESARWNLRDRRHLEELGRYEQVMPRLERTAIGVSVISRGLDDHAHLAGTTHAAMPAMGSLFIALAGAVRVLVQDVLGRAARRRRHAVAGGGRGCAGPVASKPRPAVPARRSIATARSRTASCWRASGSATRPCWSRSTASSTT